MCGSPPSLSAQHGQQAGNGQGDTTATKSYRREGTTNMTILAMVEKEVEDEAAIAMSNLVDKRKKTRWHCGMPERARVKISHCT
jgi:hypothetical protein